MRNDEKRWEKGRNDEKRWETMRNDEKRWETVRNGEKRWETMRNDAKRWETVRNGENRWETMRNGEKRSGLVWSGHENMIYIGINAQNQYILAKMHMSQLWRRTTDGQRTECEDRAILKHNSQLIPLKYRWKTQLKNWFLEVSANPQLQWSVATGYNIWTSQQYQNCKI